MPELTPEFKAFLESLGASSEPLPADDPIYTSGIWVGLPHPSLAAKPRAPFPWVLSCLTPTEHQGGGNEFE